jgi:hypothetical protein
MDDQFILPVFLISALFLFILSKIGEDRNFAILSGFTTAILGIYIIINGFWNLDNEFLLLGFSTVILGLSAYLIVYNGYMFIQEGWGESSG